MTARWRGVLLRFLVVLPCVLTAQGCRDAEALPTRLIDGSKATAPDAALAGHTVPAIATRLELVAAAEVAAGSAAATCLELVGAEARGSVVTRVGVNGESVTFRAASGRALHGCDSTLGRGGGGERWCGTAYGRLQRGRLTDPRLDVTCGAGKGTPVAFAWIEPSAESEFVAVGQPGFVEVYRVAADVPVRVTTTSRIAVEGSTASFEVSEHDRRGVLVRAYTLEARVAG